MIRRTLSLAAACVLFLGGLSCTYFLFFEAEKIPLGLLAGAGVFATIGAFWLWEDFVAPMIGPKPGA